MGKTKLSNDLRDLLTFYDQGLLQVHCLSETLAKDVESTIRHLRDKWREMAISEYKMAGRLKRSECNK